MTHLVYLVLLCFVVYREKNIAHAFYKFKKENLKFRQMVSNGILVNTYWVWIRYHSYEYHY